MDGLQLIGGVVVAVAGWSIIYFVVNPATRFFDLRSQTQVELLRYAGWRTSGDISRDHAQHEKSRSEMCRLGEELFGFSHSNKVAVRALAILGYDPMTGGMALINMSRELDRFGRDAYKREWFKLTKALKVG